MGSVSVVNYKVTNKISAEKKASTLPNLTDPLNENQKGPSARITFDKPDYIRAVSKTGECNIYPSGVPRKHFIKDTFTTLVDLQWRYTVSIFLLGFIITWTLFAGLWWLIAFYNGDLELEHLPVHQKSSNWTPCVTDISGFTSCFLFSVETQQTTGYGEKRPTEKCWEAVVLMGLQNVVGLMVDAVLVGVLLAKLIRSKRRGQTIRFSKNAVISIREDQLCLVFRLGDMRSKSRILEAKIKAQFISSKASKEGETFSKYLTKLHLAADDCDTDLFLIWPMMIVHKITRRSPLYQIRREDLVGQQFEIVVTLEGTVESTDQKTQVRSSYLAGEILWGRRFESLMTVSEEKCGYVVDYSKFDETIEVDTPDCSAAEISKGKFN